MMTSGMITLTADDGHNFQAYAAGDEEAKRALVVVQEIFGVNHHMRLVSDRLAAAGYRVLCPALFDRAERNVELGYGQEDMQRGIKLRGNISDADTMRDIEACAAALSPRATGIIGYCWGGTIAWWGATRSRSFKAASAWYGGGIAATKADQPHCPVQMHFGAEDGHIPLQDVEAINAAHPGIPVFVYDGAGHGFGCVERSSYNAQASGLAEQRSLDFFAQHLA
jgi:carboxymethylenebutenolidase